MDRKAVVVHYDAFTTVPGKGNPAGIVFDGGNFTEDEMQRIAANVGFNETSFVLPSDRADVRIRYFTPGHEMNLCGHATIATMTALRERGNFAGTDTVRIETKAGVLPVSFGSGDPATVTMRQAAAQFVEYDGDPARLAEVMGLNVGDLDGSLPVVYGSTGTWTLLVPIRSLDAFQRMCPRSDLFPQVLPAMPKASLHPFCLSAYDAACAMHARHFSSPYSGTVEDPVTGTASGVMGANWIRYVHPERTEARLWIEQGTEMGREGKVGVHAAKNADAIEVSITGTAVYAGTFEVAI